MKPEPVFLRIDTKLEPIKSLRFLSLVYIYNKNIQISIKNNRTGKILLSRAPKKTRGHTGGVLTLSRYVKFGIYSTICLFQGHERRATEEGQTIQGEQKERMQTSERFQLHNADAYCRRNGFLDDRNPVGRSNGERITISTVVFYLDK